MPIEYIGAFPPGGNGLSKPLDSGLRRNDGGDRIEKSGRKLKRALKNNFPSFPSVLCQTK